jgi:glycosyltransferase involved in cell wall biosynthesis
MSVELSVVIPIYNEAENIAPLHREVSEALAKTGRAYEIVYVDDGSTDAGDTILRDLQARDPHVVTARFPRNYGQTAALVAGFDLAAGSIVITLDGDGQNDPADIPVLLARLDAGRAGIRGFRGRCPRISRTPSSAGSPGSVSTITVARSRRCDATWWRGSDCTARCIGSSRRWRRTSARVSRRCRYTTGGASPAFRNTACRARSVSYST